MRPIRAGKSWLDALPDPLVAIDGQGRLEWANRRAAAMFGQPRSTSIGRSVLDLVHPEDLHLALLTLDSLQSEDVSPLIEVRVQAPGGWRLLEATGANCLGVPGVDCLIVTLRDLTQRRRWEVGGNDDARFRAVVSNAPSALVLLGRDGTIQATSAAVTRLLGYHPAALEGTHLLDLVQPSDVQKVSDALSVCVSVPAGDQEPVTVEAGLLDTDGRPMPFALALADMTDDPTVPGIVVSAHNITKLRAYQNALADLALKDPLTGLANRAAVDSRLQSLLDHQRPTAVAFIDLDGFKGLNDRYGHHFGDEVLRAVAQRLSDTVRPSDLVGRYGGDEFVVIAPEVGDEARLDRRLIEAMSHSVRVGERDTVIRASIGFTFTETGDTISSVLIRADRAMYGLKGNRPLRVVG
ncbi:MAG: diguanylate cyclase [Acidobacteriota bacterium]|nr:diguanylate cyclase [Acidobacteriota bacterium]